MHTPSVEPETTVGDWGEIFRAQISLADERHKAHEEYVPLALKMEP